MNSSGLVADSEDLGFSRLRIREADIGHVAQGLPVVFLSEGTCSVGQGTLNSLSLSLSLTRTQSPVSRNAEHSDFAMHAYLK